ncbi:MAG: serine/threonine protein kinase [Sandaracinaceae bacterium]|nr:serine/threonine protein kinase [Sandaracinaceae bacterium]
MGSARQPSVAATYGRYQTLFRIAAGGMAEVYAARVRGEAGFQKLVALKRMLPHLTDDDRFVNMFMDEGKLAANIDSPNVVSTMDLGRAEDGSLYLVMELVVGTTLSTLLRGAAKAGGSIPPDIACELIAQAAQGLHDAHEARTPYGAPLQLVHRDVSPQNILVGVDGRVRITDFGVARAVLRRTKTSTGEFKGKLSYFSPEQCADRELDRRSDLFSLGVVAWETLTTRRLFHAENPLAVLERVTRMPIPSAHSVRPEVPTVVADVVAKALERDRDRRHASALEFAHALRAAALESFGPVDKHAISAFVENYGGESLHRMQAQLKESLANPGALLEVAQVYDDPTEISSGIVMRPEEHGPATPRSHESASLPRFEYAPDMAPAAAPAASRAPIVVAVVVALVGLGGGAALGLWATRSRAPEEAVVHVLPAEPPAATPPSPAPPAEGAPEAAADGPPAAALAEPAAPPPAVTDDRPARRRGAVSPPPPVVRSFAEPAPAPVVRRPTVEPSPTPSPTGSPSSGGRNTGIIQSW